MLASHPVPISVIIPVYDRPELLLRAVRSVLNQTERGFELIVVDDCSPQIPVAVKEQLEEQGHSFIRLEERRGVSFARNVGVSESRGRWLAFLDSDDEWLPEKLESQLKLHREQPELLLSQTEEIWIRHGCRVNRKKIHRMASGDAFDLSVERCAISPSSVIIRRDVFLAAGGFDESMPVCEDYDLWLRLSCDYPVGLIAEPQIVKYGGHSDQLSRAYPALDCYRLFALLKLGEARGERFDLERRRILLQGIHRKSGILLKGSKRREFARADLWRAICQSAEEAGDELKSLMTLCQQYINDVRAYCRWLSTQRENLTFTVVE